MIPVKLNGVKTVVMLDSGAQPSVIDTASLDKVGSEYTIHPSRVHGVCATPIKTKGFVDLEVTVGIGGPLKQRFVVLESVEQTVILGRDFLKQFQSNEFDWQNHRVRLGRSWISTEASLWGGQVLSRAAAINSMLLQPGKPSAREGDWNISPNLNPPQRAKMRELLEEYYDVFALNPKKPNKTIIMEHVIETADARPVKAKYVRVAPRTEREINNQIDQMLANGVIRPSTSPWASRVILVQKKDGTTRFAVDYRALNDITKKDAYPIPEMKDILDKLHGSVFFSTLDGASAYWSVPISEKDREKTAFVSPRGEFEFCVMPFGLCNAPSTYQRIIDLALKDTPRSLAYIDDTLTFSGSFDDHLIHLGRVLQAYRNANLQLRKDKCCFGYNEIEFLGHSVSQYGYQPLSSNVVRIQRQARPSTVRQLRSFLGLVNYYRDFQPDLALRAAPLYELTKKRAAWNWNRECEDSYQGLCNALSRNPVTLAYPDWSRPFHLEVDASNVAVGGVLAQEDPNGRLRPISFFSSTLNEAQRRYSIGEKEAWAIVAASRKFSKYLHAAEQVIISSDHNPLVWLRQKRDPRGKFARWLLELEGLNYTVRYRRGTDNLAADYLSRSATAYDGEVNDETENLERHIYGIQIPEKEFGADICAVKDGPQKGNVIIELESTSFRDELRNAQASDPVTARAITQIRNKGLVSFGAFKKFDGMRVDDGILCRGRRIVIPSSMSDQVMRIIHDFSHWGVQRTFEEIKRKFYWRGLFGDTEKFCSACEVCLKNKRSTTRKQPLVPIKLQYNFPRATVSFDIATLPWAAGGYRYVLIMTDLFAKFIEAVPMKNQEASSIVKALEQGWFLRHGYPLALLSDQGRNVDGTLVNGLCERLGIAKLRSSPYHPEGDGQAERSVETFKQAMRCLLAERRIAETDWPALVQEVTFICNAYGNASTGYSPQEVMYGAPLRSKADCIFPCSKPSNFTDIHSYCKHAEEARIELAERVRENLLSSQRRMETNYNRGTKSYDIESGDWVWLKDETRSNSLSPVFKGPWLVIERLGVNLRIAKSDGDGGQTRIVHLNRCRKASQGSTGTRKDPNTPATQGETENYELRSYDRPPGFELGPGELYSTDREGTSREAGLPSEWADPTEEYQEVASGDLEFPGWVEQSQSPGNQLKEDDIGIRRSSRIRKKPDRYGEWS